MVLVDPVLRGWMGLEKRALTSRLSSCVRTHICATTRAVLERRASLRINLNREPKRFPCRVLDFSLEGFRVRGSFDLSCGQVVELVLGKDSPSADRCRVVWVGKAGSKQEGEVVLENRSFHAPRNISWVTTNSSTGGGMIETNSGCPKRVDSEGRVRTTVLENKDC